MQKTESGRYRIVSAFTLLKLEEAANEFLIFNRDWEAIGGPVHDGRGWNQTMTRRTI